MISLHKMYLIITLFTLISCVKSDGFEIISDSCNSQLSSNKTIQDIYNFSTSVATRYPEEDVIEGYIVSNDQSGNFFKTLSLQDLNGTIGYSIALDQTDLYTKYNLEEKYTYT